MKKLLAWVTALVTVSATAFFGVGTASADDTPVGSLGVAPEGTFILDAETMQEKPRAIFDATGHLTNAVRHSSPSDGGVVVLSVELTGTMVRLEVRDPGCAGVIAPRAPDLEHGGGFGLHVVRAVSERWGLEQVAAGGTRVWAHLRRVRTAAPASAQDGGLAVGVARNGHRATGQRQAGAGARVPEQGS